MKTKAILCDYSGNGELANDVYDDLCECIEIVERLAEEDKDSGNQVEPRA